MDISNQYNMAIFDEYVTVIGHTCPNVSMCGVTICVSKHVSAAPEASAGVPAGSSQPGALLKLYLYPPAAADLSPGKCPPGRSMLLISNLK